MRGDIEARIRVLLALLERGLRDRAQMAQGEELRPGREGVTDEVAQPTEVPEDGKVYLHGLVRRDGASYVLPFLGEAERLGERDFTRDVIRGKREEVAQLHRLAGTSSIVHPREELCEDAIHVRLRSDDIVMEKPLG